MNGFVSIQDANVPGGNQALVPQIQPRLPVTATSRSQAPTPEQRAAMDQLQVKVKVIKDMAFPAAMATAIPIAKEIDGSAFRAYRDGLLKDAGSPTDPVEIMLIEQLTLAHHRVAQLHAQAEKAKSADELKVYLVAAVRLTGELRRLALALKQYRQPTKRQFTVVKQQNIGQNQQVAYLDQLGHEYQAQIPFSDGDGELGSTEPLQIGVTPVADSIDLSGAYQLTSKEPCAYNSHEPGT